MPPPTPDVVTMDKIVALCKRRGFIFPSSRDLRRPRLDVRLRPLRRPAQDATSRTSGGARCSRSATTSSRSTRRSSSTRGSGRLSGHLAGFTDPLVDCRACKQRFRADHVDREEMCPAKAQPAQDRGPHATTSPRSRDFNLMFKTHVGPVEETGVGRLPAARDRAGHLHQLQERPAVRRKKPPFGIAQVGKSFRNEITPRQLHLPHARVRADGDGVLRPAGRGAAVVRVLEAGALRLVHAPRHPPRPPAHARARRRRAQPLLVAAPPTSSTSSRSAGPSSRASPTAATST